MELTPPTQPSSPPHGHHAVCLPESNVPVGTNELLAPADTEPQHFTRFVVYTLRLGSHHRWGVANQPEVVAGESKVYLYKCWLLYKCLS